MILLSILTFSTKTRSQNFWEQTNGPVGGSVYSLISAENGYVFAGTSSGLFYSEDYGNTWNLSNLKKSADVLAIGLEGEIFADAYGLHRSNNGINFTQILAYPVTAVAVKSNGDIFAGGFISDNPGYFTLVYRSTDNGENWESVGTFETGLSISSVAAIIIAPNEDIFVGGWHDPFSDSGGIYRSKDNGNTWTKSGLDSMSVWSLILNSQGDFFAGTEDGVFYSKDKGDTWQQLNGLDSIKVTSLVINSNDELYAGTYRQGIFRFSENNWQQIASGSTISWDVVITFNSNNELLAGSSKEGVFRFTNNNQNFIQSNSGLIISEIEDLVSNNKGDIFAVIENRGIFKSSDKGNSWEQTSLNNKLILTLAVNLHGHIFAGGQGYSGFWRSTDNGVNWTKLGLDSTIIRTIAVMPNNAIFVGTYDGIFRSEDNGESWEQAGFNDGGVIRSLAINSRNEIFAVVFSHEPRGIYRSNDFGKNWTETGLIDIEANTIAVNSKDHLFVGTAYDGGIYYSTDNGVTWQQSGLNSSDFVINSIVFNERDEIFAGSAFGGVHRSYDNGKSWSQLNEGLIEPMVKVLILTEDGFLFAGTYGNGVFKSSNAVTFVRQNESIANEFLVLDQNYPNPFNPATKIKYSIPKRSYIILKVYDILGNEITTLLNEEKPAGTYEVTWNVVNLPSGIYFYRLQAGSFVETKKMILLK